MSIKESDITVNECKLTKIVIVNVRHGFAGDSCFALGSRLTDAHYVLCQDTEPVLLHRK